MNKFLEQALWYETQGISVIPLRPKQKIPLVKWSQYQKERATPEQIKKWWTDCPDANVGVVTGKVSGIAVMDLDKYKEGYSQEEADKYLPELLSTPIVTTPRGGQHLYFRNPDDEGLTINAGAVPSVDYRGDGGYVAAPPSVNEEGVPYQWDDWANLKDMSLAPLPVAYIKALQDKGSIYKKNEVPYIENKHVEYRGDENVHTTSGQMFIEGRRDQDLFHVANNLLKGGMPVEEARQVLRTLARSCVPPMSDSDVEQKLSSAFNRKEKRSGSLSDEVRDYVMSTNGHFLSTDVHKCLQVSTREDMKNVSEILRRMVKEGLIERSGNKNGQFRLIDRDVEALNWKTATTKPMDISWPFCIEDMVNSYPGNIAVIAGAPNAGKSAFIFNFIRQNMKKHDVHLFSSEGGAEELHMRLSKFGLPIDEWTFNAWDRGSNFADVIRPGAINIIDYLEIHDEFYKIGGLLKDISDRLGDGFALICLQKNKGKDEGLGGMRGLEKPRLYMAMDYGSLKIVKGKSWANRENNPNGQTIRFKIVDGCKFMPSTPWQKEVVPE